MSAPEHGRISVFVLIDALGWRFLRDDDFLGDILPYRTPLRTVLGYSSGAIPTILTGAPPSQHGHWNLFYYDPQGSPFRWLRPFGFLPDTILDHRFTRKLLKELGRRVLGLGPLFECCVSPRLLPWFNWAEKRNIYACGGIASARSIFDDLATNGVPHRVYSYHSLSDGQILQRSLRDLERDHAGFFFLYLSELDHLLHDHCGERELVVERLRWYADGLRRVFETAMRLDPQARLTVFSDHGMTAVRHSYDLVKEIDRLGFSMPEDYLAVYDSTMARFWFFSERARSEVVEHLRVVACGRVLADDELRELGVLFPDRSYGEVIFLLHPGWLISAGDFNGRGWAPVGMHGYHPDDADSDGIFLSDREPPIVVRTIADVYRCMQAANGSP